MNPSPKGYDEDEVQPIVYGVSKRTVPVLTAAVVVVVVIAIAVAMVVHFPVRPTTLLPEANKSTPAPIYVLLLTEQNRRLKDILIF